MNHMSIDTWERISKKMKDLNSFLTVPIDKEREELEKQPIRPADEEETYESIALKQAAKKPLRKGACYRISREHFLEMEETGKLRAEPHLPSINKWEDL